MSIEERIAKAQTKIESSVNGDAEKPTARHTVYWRPSELEAVKEFGNENFLSAATTIRGGMRWILADTTRREALLDFLKDERKRDLEARRKA